MEDHDVKRIQSGNASRDGELFRGWFVGDLKEWAEVKQLSLDVADLPLRNRTDIEVKWATHAKGESRGIWAPGSSNWTMSILLEGYFVFRFRDGQNVEDAVALLEKGDYVIWDGSLEHTWQARENCTVITIRWECQAA
jgi:hypothetical protein